MNAFFRKGLITLVLLFSLFSQNSYAQVGARVRLLWAAVEAGIKASDFKFKGLARQLAKDLKMAELKGLNDVELGTMLQSIRLAAESALNKEVDTMDEFVAALQADPTLQAAINKALAKIDDSAKAIGANELKAFDSEALGELVTETARARESKIFIGTSKIIPCPDCGITQAMKIKNVKLYLRYATASETRAFKNVPQDIAVLSKSLRQDLAQVALDPNGARLNLKLSAAGEASFANLSTADKALVLQIAKDAKGALDTDTQDLARSFIRFSRDGDQTVNLSNDDRFFALYSHMSEGENKAAMKQMLDEASDEVPEAGRLTDRRMKFCQNFRKIAGNTPEGKAHMKSLDDQGCFGNFFRICK